MNEIPNTNWQRKLQRRVLIGLALCVTLVAVFYLAEDWRGKSAWENCKHDWEPKGVVLDWDKFVPTPVPDEENFFTASTNIMVMFKKPQTDAEQALFNQNTWLPASNTNGIPIFDNIKANPLLVAVIHFSPGATPAAGDNSYDLKLKLDDSSTAEQLRQLVRKTIGRSIHGPTGVEFSELSLSNIVPARVLLEAGSPPFVAALENYLPPDLDTNLGHLRIEPASGGDGYQIVLADVPPTVTAADYLKWNEQYTPALDEIREALKRPYALLPGDYSDPELIPVPSFFTLRKLAQNLAQRAQCDFLLNRPDDALREMTMIHDVCRILHRPPAGRPITLIESMINAAIAGLYADTLADGMRLHAWQEPQLAALQQQAKDYDLISLVVASLEGEEIYFSTLSLSPAFTKAVWGDKTLWQRLKDPEYVFINYSPSGWIYQNMAEHVTRMQGAIQSFDPSNQMIVPKTMDDWSSRQSFNHWNPYTFMEAIYLPNLSKAAQRTAYNQTRVNEAEVACALERYQLAHGTYPEALDALMPQFIDVLPHDVIGGGPLHYRRADGGKFLLYSVGWSGTDDNGTPGTEADMTKGNWVWAN